MAYKSMMLHHAYVFLLILLVTFSFQIIPTEERQLIIKSTKAEKPATIFVSSPAVDAGNTTTLVLTDDLAGAADDFHPTDPGRSPGVGH